MSSNAKGWLVIGAFVLFGLALGNCNGIFNQGKKCPSGTYSGVVSSYPGAEDSSTYEVYGCIPIGQ